MDRIARMRSSPGARRRRAISAVALAAALAALPAVPQQLEAQTNPAPASTYAFTIPVPVTECGFDGSAIPGAVEQQARGGARFYYVRSANGKVVIQFVEYNPKTQTAEYVQFNAADTTSTSRRKFFCMPQATFDSFTRESVQWGWRSRDFAVGALILPVKLRPGTGGAGFDFSTDVAFGTSAGWRWRLSDRRETFTSVLGGVALSSVSLTEENTRGTVTTTTDRAAFTWTLGLMLEENRFQIGAFLGQDRISQPSQANWAFQGKTWFAIGLGYTLFGAAPEKPAAKQPGAD